MCETHDYLDDDRIVGGYEAEKNKPWVAKLWVKGEFYCGASIINKRHSEKERKRRGERWNREKEIQTDKQVERERERESEGWLLVVQAAEREREKERCS